jgi:acyl-Coa thioesterase superfamily protein
VYGAFRDIGPASVWTRLKVSVVEDEQPTPLQRLVAIADSGNGMSSMLDLNRFFFIDPELTVHLHREPAGQWIKFEATTSISRGGAGLATSELSDRSGPVGRGAQALYVGPR